MTPEEEEQFIKDFRSICRARDVIDNRKVYFKELQGSDAKDKAIKIAQSSLRIKEAENNLQVLLKGKSYAYWKDFKAELYFLRRKISKAQHDILNLKF